MSFQSLLSGAECSTSNNGLAQMLKHTQQDRSLQQGDRTLTLSSSHSGLGAGMRQSSAGPAGASQDVDAFFHQQQQQQHDHHNPQASAAFDMQAMRNQLHGVAANQFRPPPPSSWADQMAKTVPSLANPSTSNLEASFGRNAMAHPVTGTAAPAASHDWMHQFSTVNPQQVLSNTSEPAATSFSRAGQPSYGMGMYDGGGMGMMGMNMNMGMGMGMGMMGQQQPQPQQQQQSSSRLVELDDAKWEEQFKRFDQQAETQTKLKDAKANGKQKETESDQLPSEAEQNESIQRELNAIEREFSAEGQETSRFEELWKSMNARNGIPGSAADAELAKWEEELFKSREDDDDEFAFPLPSGGLGAGRTGLEEMAALDGTEDSLMDGFGSVGPDGYPRLGTYRYNTQNVFLQHASPLSEGLRLLGNNGSLSDAALLFEAATQRNTMGGSGGEIDRGEVDRSRREKSEAWRRLGECQAMNEKEAQAIRALEEAIRIDENNLEAYMSLAISYTNEGYDTAAHQTLERYIQRAYSHIKPPAAAAALMTDQTQDSSDPHVQQGITSNPWSSLNRVIEMFLAAAREGNAKGQIDPEVQVGLGVLFYLNSSYDQARDCFETALQARPNDFLLWNRLGATLANGGKPEEAIESYHKALELRPTFTRAIYNLSVSCLNLGAHHEAAEHLLAALSLQQTHTLPDVPQGEAPCPTPLSDAYESHNLWSTLRRIFMCMDRWDLAQHANVGQDLGHFRNEGFEF